MKSIKKFILLFSVLSIPFIGNTKGGGFENYSLFYGTLYNPTHGILNHFELQYDINSGYSCIRRYKPKYFGFGLSATFYEQGEEYGLKYSYNLFRKSLRISRKSILVSYLFLQGNVKNIYENNKNDYNLRPGIGFTSYTYNSGILSFRSSFQIGYSLNKNTDFKNNFVMELKLGIGLN